MISRVAVASSVVILVAALVLASQGSDASYTREDVIEAFNAQGYALAEVNGEAGQGMHRSRQGRERSCSLSRSTERPSSLRGSQR
jgi:hypothetical protein